MKKQFILLFAACGFVVTSSAQDIKLGPVAGVNYSIISTSYEEEPEETGDNPSGIGAFVGFFANIGISDNFGVQPEIHISQRSSKVEDSFDLGPLGSFDVESTVSDLFIEIPVLAAIGVGDNLTVLVGPEVSILASSKVTSKVGDEEDEVTGSDATEGRNSLEVGVTAGAHIAATESLGVGVRYTRGLTSTNEDTEFASSNYNIIQLVLSWTLGQ